MRYIPNTCLNGALLMKNHYDFNLTVEVEVKWVDI